MAKLPIPSSLFFKNRNETQLSTEILQSETQISLILSLAFQLSFETFGGLQYKRPRFWETDSRPQRLEKLMDSEKKLNATGSRDYINRAKNSVSPSQTSSVYLRCVVQKFGARNF